LHFLSNYHFWVLPFIFWGCDIFRSGYNTSDRVRQHCTDETFSIYDHVETARRPWEQRNDNAPHDLHNRTRRSDATGRSCWWDWLGSTGTKYTPNTVRSGMKNFFPLRWLYGRVSFLSYFYFCFFYRFYTRRRIKIW
jgi:hypothetical protein